MPIATIQAHTTVNLGQEPEVLIVSSNPSPVKMKDFVQDEGASSPLVYDTDADLLAGWLKKVFCTMTLGRVARKLAEHTGYLMEVDPHKPRPVQDEESLKLHLWKRMLRSVVPNRLEFMDDPGACAAHIRERVKKLKLELEIANQGKGRLEEWKKALEEMAIPEYADNLVACKGYIENELYRLRREGRQAMDRHRKLRAGCGVPEGMSIAEYIGSLKFRISDLEDRLEKWETGSPLWRPKPDSTEPQPAQPPPDNKGATYPVGSPLPSRLALNTAREILKTYRVLRQQSWLKPKPLPVAEAIAEIIDRVTMLPKWQAALEGLVPSGPEYVDNPDVCAKYIQGMIPVKEPTPEKEKCKGCDGRGWVLIGSYHEPNIGRCGVCGVFSTNAAAVNYVAQLAYDAACIAEHQKSQGL